MEGFSEGHARVYLSSLYHQLKPSLSYCIATVYEYSYSGELRVKDRGRAEQRAREHRSNSLASGRALGRSAALACAQPVRDGGALCAAPLPQTRAVRHAAHLLHRAAVCAHNTSLLNSGSLLALLLYYS